MSRFIDKEDKRIISQVCTVCFLLVLWFNNRSYVSLVAPERGAAGKSFTLNDLGCSNLLVEKIDSNIFNAKRVTTVTFKRMFRVNLLVSRYKRMVKCARSSCKKSRKDPKITFKNIYMHFLTFHSSADKRLGGSRAAVYVVTI